MTNRNELEHVPTDPWIEAYDYRAAMKDVLFLLDHAHDPLTVLRVMADLRRHGDAIREEATKDARRQGHTWEQIAEASKTTRQEAHRKYRYVDDELEADSSR